MALELRLRSLAGDQRGAESRDVSQERRSLGVARGSGGELRGDGERVVALIVRRVRGIGSLCRQQQEEPHQLQRGGSQAEELFLRVGDLLHRRTELKVLPASLLRRFLALFRGGRKRLLSRCASLLSLGQSFRIDDDLLVSRRRGISEGLDAEVDLHLVTAVGDRQEADHRGNQLPRDFCERIAEEQAVLRVEDRLGLELYAAADHVARPEQREGAGSRFDAELSPVVPVVAVGQLDPAGHLLVDRESTSVSQPDANRSVAGQDGGLEVVALLLGLRGVGQVVLDRAERSGAQSRADSFAAGDGVAAGEVNACGVEFCVERAVGVDRGRFVVRDIRFLLRRSWLPQGEEREDASRGLHDCGWIEELPEGLVQANSLQLLARQSSRSCELEEVQQQVAAGPTSAGNRRGHEFMRKEIDRDGFVVCVARSSVRIEGEQRQGRGVPVLQEFLLRGEGNYFEQRGQHRRLGDPGEVAGGEPHRPQLQQQQ